MAARGHFRGGFFAAAAALLAGGLFFCLAAEGVVDGLFVEVVVGGLGSVDLVTVTGLAVVLDETGRSGVVFFTVGAVFLVTGRGDVAFDVATVLGVVLDTVLVRGVVLDTVLLGVVLAVTARLAAVAPAGRFGVVFFTVGANFLVTGRGVVAFDVALVRGIVLDTVLVRGVVLDTVLLGVVLAVTSRLAAVVPAGRFGAAVFTVAGWVGIFLVVDLTVADDAVGAGGVVLGDLLVLVKS